MILAEIQSGPWTDSVLFGCGSKEQKKVAAGLSEWKESNFKGTDRMSIETGLFDNMNRTFVGFADRGESQFDYLNRSARASEVEARNTLESWFARFPLKKRTHIRSRFRGGDRQHLGALLELSIHEVLCAVGTGVRVDPIVEKTTPDFAFTYNGVRIIVECTVVQESDDDFNATQMENTIKKAVDSIDIKGFKLEWELLSHGRQQPKSTQLCREIERWIASVDSGVKMEGLGRRSSICDKEFLFGDGWKVSVAAIPVGSETQEIGDGRAIGMEVSGGWRHDDDKLRCALKAKALKYRPRSPYVIVVGSGVVYADCRDMCKALFGRKTVKPYINPPGSEVKARTTHKFDGLFGSPRNPKNRHVSAVLFKPRLNLWTLCGSDDPWQLFHNPGAQVPLPSGVFGFATEWVLTHRGFSNVQPTCTLNHVLGLCDAWPGREH